MDTVKVRMQISTNSLFAVIRNTYREGPLTFFRGMEFPLLSVPIINACVFTSYEFWRRILQSNDDVPMEYWKVYIPPELKSCVRYVCWIGNCVHLITHRVGQVSTANAGG